MKYRPFGRTGWQVSVLGLGCMRLPTLGAYEKVNEPEAIRLIRHAIDGGVNYVDSAWGYHGQQSEVVLGKALADGYRDRVKVVTKMPTWLVKEPADFERFLTGQLGKLQTDRIDLYLMHALGRDGWHKVRDFGILEWADRAIASGRIGHFGFSFHDEYEVFKEIVDAWDRWTACMVQYNYLFTEKQAGTKGVRYAASKGLAVVAMEPVYGGNLAAPPASVRAILDRGSVRRTPVDWALQWVWNQPEVNVVLSGMSTLEQVDQNLASADHSGPGQARRRRRARRGGSSGRHPRAAADPLHALQLLHALPERGEHPPQPRPLQLRGDVRPVRPVPRGLHGHEGGRAGLGLYRLRPV